MNSIEIFINNLGSEKYLYIDTINNIVKINNQEKKIDAEIINNLIRTIRTWENKYYDNKLIDAEEFIIKINSNNHTEVIRGKGKYPKNYDVFKKIIGELYV